MAHPAYLGYPSLTRHKRVPLAALEDQRFILFPRRVTPGLHDVVTGMCRNAGFSLNVAHEVDNVVGGMTLVSAGLGVGFCTPSVQKLWPNIAFRSLADSAPYVEYSVAYRRDAQSPVLDTFLRVVRQTARKTRPR